MARDADLSQDSSLLPHPVPNPNLTANLTLLGPMTTLSQLARIALAPCLGATVFGLKLLGEIEGGNIT